MKIFTNEQIKSITRHAIDRGLALDTLIDNYATLAAAEIAKRYDKGTRTIVYAGPGGNGADALAVARHLAVSHGFEPLVYLFNIGGDKTNDVCRRQKALLEGAGVAVDEVIKSFLPPEPDLNAADVVVDGLFGSGLTGALQGGFKVVAHQINESGAQVVSIDVPSGMVGDWNARAVNQNIVNATLTLAVQFPRLAFMLTDNATLVGNWMVIPTGIPQADINNTKANYFFVQEGDIKPVIMPRDPYKSKADYGHAIVFAGSYGMMGAALLATRGALRAGAGHVTAHTPRCGFSIMQSQAPEAMYQPDQGDIRISDFTLDRAYDAVAIGPGIGTHDDTIDALDRFLKVANANSRPLVLDADALNCIAKRPQMINHIPVTSVITPHDGEFDRLFGTHVSSESRLRRAIEAARHHQLLIVMKGRYTAVVRPDGRIYFNSTGTPALATPGSGDVLTGLIAGLMAQGYKPEIASIAAVYIHGLAGQIAGATHGAYSTLAGDVADAIGPAISRLI